MTGLQREALRQIEDGPVKRPYLSLIRNRTTWSDLRLADGEQYTVGERVDAVELTPEVRAALAAREDTDTEACPDCVEGRAHDVQDGGPVIETCATCHGSDVRDTERPEMER